MGRKKGRQAGEFQSKSQHAVHRHTVYVDHASEANHSRNPLLMADLGRGHGYRNASPRNNGVGGSGYWHSNGNGYGGGDKWSSIFSSSRSGHTHAQIPDSSGSDASRATMGLSRLRFLLEERRVEDRVHDRQHRLRLQRSRIIEAGASSRSNNTQQLSTSKNNSKEDRHEPGWLLTYPTGNDSEKVDMEPNHTLQSTSTDDSELSMKTNEIPSLQNLAARTLGPLLPMYAAACGNHFVGESLKSVSSSVLSELATSLAMSDWSSENNGNTMFATTDGAVKAMVHSGAATGLVLRGAPLYPLNDNSKSQKDETDDDTRWLSDNGLLSLCPRILPISIDSDGDTGSNRNLPSNEDDDSSQDHWESLDFDMGLNSRMAGCFHLKRLELIDIPLQRETSSFSSGGISLQALRAVLRSCSGITHLSLSGSFYNWEDGEYSPASLASDVGDSDNISMFLCGTQSLTSLAHSIKMLGKLRNGEEAMHLIPKLLFHQMFEENIDQRNEISGLDTLLPELRVLDVSHCSWVQPGMIIKLLLKFWERALNPTAEGNDDNSSNGSEWEEEGEHPGGDAAAIANHGGDIVTTINNGNHPLDHHTSRSCRKQCPANINTSLRHMNIRGCIGLLPASSSLPSWMEEWRGHGLFDGIDVSTERHLRRC